MIKTRVFAWIGLLLLPLSAWSAGGHYPVDDAGITAPGDIQIESWITRVNSDNVEFGFLPAVTVLDRLELTAGVYRIETGAGDFMRFEPAAKLALPISGVPGVSLAVSLALGVDDGRLEDGLLNLPLTAEVSEAFTLHANAGWLHLRSAAGSVDRLFLGLGGELAMSEALGLIGQVYREGAEAEPEAQAGLRWTPTGGALDHVDLAAGRPLRGRDRDWFITLGVTFTF